MPETLMKSTTVRALRTAMGILEGLAPGLGARWVDRLWFSVPRPRPTKREIPADDMPFELMVSGATVRGHRWGDNEKVVYLIHGWGSSSTQHSAASSSRYSTPVWRRRVRRSKSWQLDPGPSGPGRSNALEHRDVLRAVVAAHGPAYGVVAHSLGSMVAALAMRDGIVPQRAVYVAPMIDVTSYGEPFVRTLGGGPRIWAKFVKRVEPTRPAIVLLRHRGNGRRADHPAAAHRS